MRRTEAPGRDRRGRALLSALCSAALLLAAACRVDDTDESTEIEDQQVTADIERVLERRTPELMKIDGVNGVGQALCDGKPCIRVYLADAAVQARVPDTLDGIPVSTVVTGMIRPTPGDSSPPL